MKKVGVVVTDELYAWMQSKIEDNTYADMSQILQEAISQLQELVDLKQKLNEGK